MFLALFSSQVTDAEKRLCAKAMLRYHHPTDCSQEPTGKLVTPLLRTSTKLRDLFGYGSWLLPNLCGIGLADKSFVAQPVDTWPSNKDYQTLKGIVSNLQVVNDPAERGILLAKSLQGKISRCSDERTKLFLSIPHVRAKLTKLTKKNLINLRCLC